MKTKWMTALVVLAAAAMFAPAHAEAAGTTQITIGTPTYDNPITTATVPVTIELDGKQTGFTSVSVDVTCEFFIKLYVPVSFGPITAPLPGKGSTTFNVFFPVTKGTTYSMTATMYYRDANNQPAFLNALPAMFTP